MEDLFKILGKRRQSQPALQDARRRMNQQPQISDAQSTADSGLAEPPVGAMLEWPGALAPANGKWAICDGALFSSLDYPDLYAVCGTTFNVGNEAADTFRIPDRRGYVGIGAGIGDASVTNYVLGLKYGAESHVLTLGQIPIHNHGGSTGNDGLHNHGGATAAAGNHDHGGFTTVDGLHSHVLAGASKSWVRNQNALASGAPLGQDGPRNITWTEDALPPTTNDGNHNHVIPNTPSHAHTIPNEAAHAHTIASQGSGQSHNNLQPSMAINYIIRISL